MSEFTPILRKELREIRRDPYLLGIAIFLPLVLLFLFAYALNLDVKDVPMAVVDMDRTPQSQAYLDAFRNSGQFRVVAYADDPRHATRLMDQGKVQVVMQIPAGFGRRLERGDQAQVSTAVDGTFPTSARVIIGYVEAINQAYAMRRAEERLQRAGPLARAAMDLPMVIPVAQIRYNPGLRSANFIVPGLIAVILMAFPPLLSALAIVREKEHGSIQQIFVSPLPRWAFIVGKLIPYVMIAFGELLLVLLATRYWFQVPIAGNVWLFLLASVPYVVSTVAIGLLVSTFTRSQLAAMLLAIVLTMMPAFIFSGFLFPITSMPQLLQYYAYLFPARYFTEITLDVFLKGLDISHWWVQFVVLLVYTLALVVVAALRFKKKVG
jgi:ABC-2 type transport system permease protein